MGTEDKYMTITFRCPVSELSSIIYGGDLVLDTKIEYSSIEELLNYITDDCTILRAQLLDGFETTGEIDNA